MIKSFKHKGIEEFFYTGKKKRHKAWTCRKAWDNSWSP